MASQVGLADAEAGHMSRLTNAVRIAKESQGACPHDQVLLHRRGTWVQYYDCDGYRADTIHRLGNRWGARCSECGLKADGSISLLPEWARNAAERAERREWDAQASAGLAGDA